jgi:Flp pilus assembly protein TadG
MVAHAARYDRHRRGAAAVELATVLPLLLTLLLGLWEVGRIADVRQGLANAAREGARQASAGQIGDVQVAQVVRDYLRNAGLPVQNVVVTVQNLTSLGTDSTNAAQLDQFQVTVTIPFRDVRLVNIGLTTNDSTTLTGQATLCSMKDKPYAAPPEPPIE